ncbi:MAG: STAS domain-containing protein [Sphingomonadales bacterium]|nr:MAG: STAS domain-containing protein [Sphingomonadales bacterium]
MSVGLVRIRLPDTLDLACAADLRSSLVDAINESSAIAIDASGVRSLTTPCIQVLLAASKDAQKRNAKIFVESASAPFLRAIEEIGLNNGLISGSQ